MVATRSGKAYDIGQNIRVRVAKADSELGQIDFELADSVPRTADEAESFDRPNDQRARPMGHRQNNSRHSRQAEKRGDGSRGHSNQRQESSRSGRSQEKQQPARHGRTAETTQSTGRKGGRGRGDHQPGGSAEKSSGRGSRHIENQSNQRKQESPRFGRGQKQEESRSGRSSVKRNQDSRASRSNQRPEDARSGRSNQGTEDSRSGRSNQGHEDARSGRSNQGHQDSRSGRSNDSQENRFGRHAGKSRDDEQKPGVGTQFRKPQVEAPEEPAKPGRFDVAAKLEAFFRKRGLKPTAALTEERPHKIAFGKPDDGKERRDKRNDRRNKSSDRGPRKKTR